jgi:PKD repeat protein
MGTYRASPRATSPLQWALLLLAITSLLVPGLAGVRANPLSAPRGLVSPASQDLATQRTSANLGMTSLNGSGTATPGWANISASAGAPPAYRSYGRSFTYDPADGYDVLFGGYGAAGGYLQDTWTFHAGKWTELFPSTHPSARDHSTLAWDPVDRYLLLFGGSGTGGAYSDTWTFFNGTWTQLSPHTHPSARWASAMTWDAADQEMVLFGGCVAGTAAGDTWTFLHGNWTQLSPHPAPSGRENVALQFDPHDNYTVLFGGDDYYSALDGDTWVFSAGNWTQLHPATAPSPRSEAGFAYFPRIDSLVLFGGSGASTFGDTWWFSGGEWSERSPIESPAAREFGILADDPADSELVLFSGQGGVSFDDTWVYYGLNLTASESASTGVAPLVVAFSANVSSALGAIQYTWNLGDGNSSSKAAPDENYTSAGLYFPSLEVADANGSTAVAYLEIKVGIALSTSAVGGPSSGLVPLVVEYSALSSGGSPPYWYLWSSSAGNSSNLSAPTFTFEFAGLYSVSLVAGDSAGGRQYRNFTVTAVAPTIPPLTASVFAAPTIGEAPLPVSFDAGGSGGVAPYTFAWEFGDGTTGAGATVNHTYSAGGPFTATVTVTDSEGRSVVQSTPILVEAALTVTASATPTSGHAPLGVAFEAQATGGSAPYVYSWDLGDGTTSASSGFNHTYSTSGTYPITLIVTDGSGHQAAWNSTIVVSAGTPVNTPPATSAPSASGPTNSDLVTVVAEVVLGAVAIAAIIVYMTRIRR